MNKTENEKRISLTEAMDLCDYNPNVKSEFIEFIEKNYDNNRQRYLLYLKKDNTKIILLKIILPTLFKDNFYDISLLIYFQNNYPKTLPDIYLQKTGKVRINPNCLFYINENTLQINYNLFFEWKENFNSLTNLLSELKNQFSIAFPIFTNHKEEQNDIVDIEGYSTLNHNLCTLIQIQKDNNLLKQINVDNKNKDKRNKSPNQNNKLNEIDAIKNLKSLIMSEIGAKVEMSNKQNNQILQKILKTKNEIKAKLKEVDYLENKAKEIQNSIYKVSKEVNQYYLVKPEQIKYADLSKLDSLLLINKKKYFMFKAKEKAIEEYLLICKKAFEKKTIDLKTAISLLRHNTRYIYYLRYQSQNSLING